MLNFVSSVNRSEATQRKLSVADPKQEESFKVIDRRLFNEEGQLRQDVLEQEKREEEAAKKSAAKGQNASAGSKPGAPESAQKSAEKTPQAGAAETADTQTSSRGFQMLVDFLTRNAAAMLGGMADPQTGQPFVDLEGAREVIDMLDALREKTRGNLAKADEDLQLEVLGSLKLTFMEVSKAAAEAMAKKAGKKG
jgi:Domain of unknown function (DUF1844)